MHEISFQAASFLPRLFSVITLLLLTLLVAKFAKTIIQRATRQDKKGSRITKFVNKLSDITFWMVILFFSSFIIGAAGLDEVWLRQVQLYLGQLYSNWPIWILISMIVAGISYLLLNIQKLIIQLKGSPGTSPKKY
jgi:hypothetical protein